MASLAKKLCVLLAFTSAAATLCAQELPLRIIPTTAQYGMLHTTSAFEATIDRKAVRLSPGMRLFNPQNMMVLPSSILQQNTNVAYTLDVQGFVQQAWILTPGEQPAATSFIEKLLSGFK